MVSNDNDGRSLESMLASCMKVIDCAIDQEDYITARNWNHIFLCTLNELDAELSNDQVIKYSTLYLGYKDIIFNKL
jgi:hypothetical protein